jgi:hypothetical protein
MCPRYVPNAARAGPNASTSNPPTASVEWHSMALEDELKRLLASARDTVGDDGFTDGQRINATLGRDSDDLRTDNGLTVLHKRGYIKGYRDGEGHWEYVELTALGAPSLH